MNTYLEFVQAIPLNPERKTKIMLVKSTRSGQTLGVIRWYGPWRQYTFYPARDTIWNPDCLDAVNEEIRRLMAERRK